MGDKQLLAQMGTNGAEWAQEFCERFVVGFKDETGMLVHDAEYLMTSWFANAIEAGRSEGFHEGAAHLSHHASEVD